MIEFKKYPSQSDEEKPPHLIRALDTTTSMKRMNKNRLQKSITKKATPKIKRAIWGSFSSLNKNAELTKIIENSNNK